MKGSVVFLLFLGMLSSCVKHEYPTACRGSGGMAIYECEAYRWVAACDGPIELRSAWVTTGVMTDQSLGAECSNIAGLCIGRDAWIKNSVIHSSSSIGTFACFYDSVVHGKLSVGEELDAHCTHFKGEVCVGGDVTAHGCRFEDKLTATSEVICLYNTHTKSIHVCPCGPYYDPQIIKLAECSHVEGNIVFASGRGRLVLDPTSSFQGCIIGGHVIEPFECDKLYY